MLVPSLASYVMLGNSLEHLAFPICKLGGNGTHHIKHEGRRIKQCQKLHVEHRIWHTEGD